MRWLVIAVLVVGARTADAKGCSEHSDVVGLHHCSRFGAWWSREGPTPRVWLELGYFRHTFASEPVLLGPDARTTSAGVDLSSRTHGVAWRVLAALDRLFYLGGEMQMGGFIRLPQTTGLAPNNSGGGSLHALAGAHVVYARFALAAELAAGGRVEALSYCSGPKTCPFVDIQARRELEGRLQLGLFIHPNFSLDAMYGHSLLNRDDHTWMFGLTVHGRVMDGML